MRQKILVFILSYLGCCSASTAMEFYVNPNGNDAWSGKLKVANAQRTDGPFKTIEKAKLAVKSFIRSSQWTSKININIAAGRYFLEKPLRFDQYDSGAYGKEVTWRGEPGEKIVISGGIPLACSPVNKNQWDCPLTKAPLNRTYFDTDRIKGNVPKFELFVNGQKLELARWPNEGWAHIKKPLTATTQFSVMENMPNFSGDAQNAQVHIFAGSDWFDEYVGVSAVKLSGNTIFLANATRQNLQSGRRFVIRNVKSELDAPGEWIYDSANRKIVFIPFSDAAPDEFIISSAPNLFFIYYAQYLNFQNLSFQHSAATALLVRSSGNIVFDGIDVSNIGGKGFDISYSQDLVLKNSTIHHTGGDGADISGGDRATLTAPGYVIANNYIHDVGTTLMTYTPALMISGVGFEVSHNVLSEGPGTGLLIVGNDHLVEKNEIYHFCMQASDCGAVYSGRDWTYHGNIIRNNYIHDILGYGLKSMDTVNNTVNYASPADARGIYLDDAASGFNIQGNILENIGSRAINIGGGRNNSIINNFIKTDSYAILIDNRWADYAWSLNLNALNKVPYRSTLWKSKYPDLAAPMNNYKWPEGNRIERNVIVSTKANGSSLQYSIPFDSTIINDNIVWNTNNKIAVDYKILESAKAAGGAQWSQWVAQGIEVNSIIADPCATVTNKQLKTCSGSPVATIGFEPIPDDIGLINPVDD